MCTVVNKYKESYDVYIGRGSVWGNPFPMKNKTDTERTRVIELYRIHLKEQFDTGAVNKAMLRSLAGKKLGCFCKPKACHGDVIVQAVAWALESN